MEDPAAFKMKDVKILNIVSDGRSGSLYIQSLFDDHTQVIVFPGVLISSIDHFWRNHSHACNKTELIEKFINSHPAIFDSRKDDSICALDKLGESKAEYITTDQSVFKKNAWEYLNANNYDFHQFFLALHFALGTAQNKAMDNIKCIVHALHLPSEEQIRFFHTNIPSANYLITIREPLTSWFSGLNVRRKIIDNHSHYFNKKSLFHICSLVPTSEVEFLLYHETLQLLAPEQVRVLRIEDINNSFSDTVSKLSAWIGIENQQSLTKSTYGGKIWWGDSTMASASNDGYNFDPKYFKRDKLVIESLLRHRLTRYGYRIESQKNLKDRVFPKLLLCLPTKWETEVLKEYFLPSKAFYTLMQTLKNRKGAYYKMKYGVLYTYYFYSSLFPFIRNYFKRIIAYISYWKRAEANKVSTYIKI